MKRKKLIVSILFIVNTTLGYSQKSVDYYKEDHFQSNSIIRLNVKTIKQFKVDSGDTILIKRIEYDKSGNISTIANYNKSGSVSFLKNYFYSVDNKLIKLVTSYPNDTTIFTYDYSKDKANICLNCNKRDSINVVENYHNGNLLNRKDISAGKVERESKYEYKENCITEKVTNYLTTQPTKYVIKTLYKNGLTMESFSSSDTFHIFYFYKFDDNNKIISQSKIFLEKGQTSYFTIWQFNSSELIKYQNTYDYLGNLNSSIKFEYEFW